MRFNQFVFRNTIRNKTLYMAYFFSVLSTVMTFFTFSVFAFHPSLSGDLHQSVKMGMAASSIIIYLFSFLFVWYSVDIFLQSRKKEFGLLLIQGMSPKQLRKMIFQENMLVGFFSTVFGILVGTVFAQVILWLSRVTLHVNLGFYMPWQAVGVTFGSFIVLFTVISILIQFKIPKMDIQTLLKSQELGKGKLQASKWQAIAAVLLIGIGYAVALSAKGIKVVAVMLPVIFIVILGTHLLFRQATLWGVEHLQKKETYFWKKTNLLLFSDLSFRMKDNAKSFFLVTVISTVAFSAIGTLVGFKEMSLKGVTQTPYAMTYYNSDPQIDGEKEINQLNQDIKKAQIEATQGTYELKGIQLPNGDYIQVIQQSTYNRLAKKIGEKEFTEQTAGVHIRNRQKEELMDAGDSEPYQLTKLPVTDKVEIPVKESFAQKEVIPTFSQLVIIPDDMYALVINDFEKEVGSVWLTPEESREELIAFGKAHEDNYQFVVKEYVIRSVTDMFAPILFIGLFIGLVFFVSAGSFLYFRLYSDMALDKEKFKMVHKIGFSKKEMQRVIYRQIAILFFTPIVVSCLHGGVALTAMYALFNQPLQVTALLVLGTFIVIQVIYYLFARRFYFHKLYTEVTR